MKVVNKLKDKNMFTVINGRLGLTGMLPRAYLTNGLGGPQPRGARGFGVNKECMRTPSEN